MPQLDKYIFFNQIFSLTIFFILIYIYIRATVIPKISSLLKYRKKKLNLLNKQINIYNRDLNNLKIGANKKSTYCINIISNDLNSLINFYKIESNFQLKILYNDVLNLKKNNRLLNFSILKNKFEQNRIKKLNK